MENQGDFIFCESDYTQTSFSAFQSMKEKGEHIDISIRSKTRWFFAHRVVLAARIPYFRKKLPSQATKISLNEIDPDVLQSIINFAYEGKLKITAENVQPMLLASTILKLKAVQKACREFLRQRYNSNTKLRIPSIKLVPADLSIRENFDEFSSSQEFLFLPYSSLKELVSRNDLKVKNEEKVFEAVIKWVKMSPIERQPMLPHLLTEIRMVNLTPDYLIEQVATEEMIQTSDPCKHMVEEAKSYHLLPQKRSMFRSFNVNPRIYTDKYQNVASGSANQIDSCDTMDTAAPQNVARDKSLKTSTEQKISCDVTVKNGVYAVCSFNCRGTFVTFYDHENKTWYNFPASGPGEGVLAAVFVNDKIYAFFPSLIGTFHLRTREWTTLEQMPFTVKGPGIVSHENIVYVFGGLFTPRRLRCFDTKQNKWLPDEQMRTPRHNMGIAASSENCIYLTGGFTTLCSNSVERYSPVSKTWTEMPSMHFSRKDHGCACLNCKIYVCGGRSRHGRLLDTAEVYDTQIDEWYFMSTPNVPRYSPSLVSSSGKLYVLGGMTHEDTCFAGAEVYDPVTEKWEACMPITPLQENNPDIIKAVVVSVMSG